MGLCRHPQNRGREHRWITLDGEEFCAFCNRTPTQAVLVDFLRRGREVGQLGPVGEEAADEDHEEGDETRLLSGLVHGVHDGEDHAHEDRQEQSHEDEDDD